jgi:threonine dehydrogenase-like Zn-dependent dehydrogenase
MRAVTYQAPGEVRVDDVAEPVLENPDEAIIAVEATGVCGSDLHIFHGRVPVDPGTVIGHEYVGKVLAVGDAVTRVAVGDRVLGTFLVACGSCTSCLRGDYHRCERGRTFGHGKNLGALGGTQADQALVPFADIVLRKVPEGMSADTALFAGDVMGTGYHAVAHSRMQMGDTVAVLGLGPVGLCAVQTALAGGASHVFAVDSVEERLELAAQFGATPVHLTEGNPKAEVRGATGGRGADVVIEAVGAPAAVDAAISLARNAGTVSGIGVQVGKSEMNLGLAWLKGLDIRLGQANVIAHVDAVMALLESGKLDPTPLVTNHMKLDEAAEAYALFDRREALKIVLTP